MRKRYLTAVGVAAMVASLATAAGAQAQITLGQLAPGTASPYCTVAPVELIPATVASGNGYSAPTAGVITSWSTNATEGAGQDLNFEVFRPLAPEEFLVVARDTGALTPGVVNTFKVSIPVQAGDVIGDEDANATSAVPNACVFETSDSADRTRELGGEAAPGETVVGNGSVILFLLPNVSATLLPPPTITLLGTTSGPTAGGTSVTIAGTNFAEVQGVSFGSTPASYTVDSEGQITATAPSGGAGEVPVTVTTVAGSATAAEKFSYQATAVTVPPAPPVPIMPVTPAPTMPVTPTPTCTVPKLKGKKLKAAKRAIRKAHCKVGHVKEKKGVPAKTGEVVRQKPKPGTVRGAGSGIAIKLG